MIEKSRLAKVKSILVSQPKPSDEDSPYHKLARKYDIQVDFRHFFSLCREMKIEMPSDMKYFCISDQTANYLQKYIVIRKRKIFTGSKTAQDLIEILKKHKNEKYVFPCSNIRKNDIHLIII